MEDYGKAAANTGPETRMFHETTERMELFYKHYLGTPTAMLFTDCQGTIIDANNAFLDLYGYRIEEVRGKNPRILKSGRQSPAVYNNLWRTITDREIGAWSGELINRKKNGDEVYIYLTISSVFRPDGTPAGYVAGGIDISDRKEMELKLRARNEELERLSLFKTDMMAITSHDLRAPLNAMISYADLLREGLGRLPPQTATAYLDKIIRYGSKMTNFINDILDLRMAETGRFKLASRRARVDSLLLTCAELNGATAAERGIRISVSCRGKRRTAAVDEVKMEQVFNNLLANAVKFSPDNSEVKALYEDEGNGALRVSIEDRGPGIPEPDLPYIFDPYYQAERKGAAAKRVFGAGLGLSIVRNIMGLHRGRVAAENLPEAGCRFVLDFPVKTITSFECLAIMIIDPGGELFGHIEPIARSRQVPCFIVRNALEAARVCESENPDIIWISNAVLTGDLLTFLRKVKAEDAGICLVALSDAGAAGASGLFSRTLAAKPAGSEVDSVLAEVLARKQAECGYDE